MSAGVRKCVLIGVLVLVGTGLLSFIVSTLRYGSMGRAWYGLLIRIDGGRLELPHSDFAGFDSSIAVRYAGCTHVTAKAVAHLRAFPEIANVILERATTDANALAELRTLPNLKRLELRHVSDEMLAGIGRLTQLQELWIEDSRDITDAGVRHLAALVNLRKLGLRETRMTDASLSALAGMQQLEELDLGTERVAEFPAEEHVPISDAGLVHLGGLPQLKFLYLNSTCVTDEGLGRLSSLKKLECLFLNGTYITDAGLSRLLDLPNLTYVCLAHTRVTDDGTRSLKDAASRLGRALKVD